MTYAEILEQARAALSPRCTVCPVCNGRACAGRIPGPGGKGTGATAQRNFSYLAEHVKVEQRVLRAPLSRNSRTRTSPRTRCSSRVRMICGASRR